MPEMSTYCLNQYGQYQVRSRGRCETLSFTLYQQLPTPIDVRTGYEAHFPSDILRLDQYNR